MKHHYSRNLKSLCALVLALSLLCGCNLQIMPPQAYDDSELYLYYAINSENEELVRECIESGVDINQAKGGSILLVQKDWLTEAVNLGYGDSMRTIKMLLDSGADVNQKDILGFSPMMRACGADYENNYYAIDHVKLFLEYGGDINLRSKQGLSSLDYAVQCWDVETVKMLIEKGGEVTRKTFEIAKETYSDYTDFSMIHLIAEQMKSSKIDMGLDPMTEAALLGNSESVIQQTGEAGLNNNNREQVTAYAAAFCSPETMQALISKDIAYDDTLSVAAENGNVPMMKYLIGIGMDVNAEDSYEYTPLFNAVYNGRYEAAELLFSKGADIEDKTSDSYSYGMDLAEYAAYDADVKMLDLLVKNGLYLNDKNRFTLINDAVTDNGTPFVEYLLNGVNLTDYRDELTEALETACESNFTEIASLLIEKGADVNGIGGKGAPLYYAALHGNAALVKFMIEKGAAVNNLNKDDETALMSATRYGYFDIIKLLVENGAEINTVCGENDDTVLTVTAQTSNHILQYFIEKGGNINTANADGDTALMLAVTARLKNNVTLLWGSGAKDNNQNSEGQTAWDIAQSENNKVMMDILESEISLI